MSIKPVREKKKKMAKKIINDVQEGNSELEEETEEMYRLGQYKERGVPHLS